MPWFLESDTLADDPVWDVLSGGNATRADAIISAYARLKAKASHTKRDGYVTADMALQICRGRRQVLEALCRAVLDDPPLLHREGDECECLGGRWIDGFAFRFHNFLKKNPSRTEYDRNRNQKAELASSALKQAVYVRDGGCCRYCGSGPLSPKAGKSRDLRKVLTYDHVDPDALAGPDAENLVVCCKRCNTHKGRRTPDEADMMLLPVPTAVQAAALRARAQILCDLPEPGQQSPAGSAQDHREISAGSPENHRPISDPASDRITDPIADPGPDRTADPDTESTGPVHPRSDRSPTSGDTDQPSEVSGLGRVGQPDPDRPPRPPTTDPAGQPYREAHTPDVYHRRARLAPRTQPDDHPPAALGPEPPNPDFEWPTGTVPTPPDDQAWASRWGPG